MNLRHAALFALVLASLAGGCNKSDAPSGDSANAAAKGGQGGVASAANVEARLTKAGFTIESKEDNGFNWPSLYIKVEKTEGDNSHWATIWFDAMGEATEGAPKPVITPGKDAFLRFGWEPSPDKKAAPDLAAYAKDVAAIVTPEKAVDGFFFGGKYEEMAKKWKLSDEGSRSGGRAALSNVVFNHRFLSGDAGTLTIEQVDYGKAVSSGSVKLVGTTFIAVESPDEPTKKAVFDALTGG